MRIFDHKEATPLELFDHMVSLHGSEWLLWEPETMWQTMSLESGGKHTHSRNKLQAIQVVMNNNLFWKDWGVFEKVVSAFNNGLPEFHVMEEVSPAEMAYAVRVAYKMRRNPAVKKAGKDPAFNSEVKSYIAARAFMDGTVYLADNLNMAQSALNGMTGMSSLAKEIADKSKNLNLEIEETPVSIGAVKALIVRAYAFSDARKPIV